MPIDIVVDLDRSLLVTDTLQEQVAVCFFCNPLFLVHCLFQSRRGRAAFKIMLAERFPIFTENLPVRAGLLDWLRSEIARGRRVHLCSAAAQPVVDAVADRIGIFTTARGSGTLNLKGKAKAELLMRTFPDGFSYVGDSRADLAVWQQSKGIILAGASPVTAKAARGLGKPIEAEFAEPSLATSGWILCRRISLTLKDRLHRRSSVEVN